VLGVGTSAGRSRPGRRQNISFRAQADRAPAAWRLPARSPGRPPRLLARRLALRARRTAAGRHLAAASACRFRTGWRWSGRPRTDPTPHRAGLAPGCPDRAARASGAHFLRRPDVHDRFAAV